jgi:hypothetical protein
LSLTSAGTISASLGVTIAFSATRLRRGTNGRPAIAHADLPDDKSGGRRVRCPQGTWIGHFEKHWHVMTPERKRRRTRAILGMRIYRGD